MQTKFAKGAILSSSNEQMLEQIYTKMVDMLASTIDARVEAKMQILVAGLANNAFQELVRGNPRDFRRLCLQEAPTAFAFLTELVSGKISGASVAIRAKYAAYLLSCAGYGPQKRIMRVQQIETLTDKDVAEIKERALRARRESLQPTGLNSDVFLNDAIELGVDEYGEIIVMDSNAEPTKEDLERLLQITLDAQSRESMEKKELDEICKAQGFSPW